MMLKTLCFYLAFCKESLLDLYPYFLLLILVQRGCSFAMQVIASATMKGRGWKWDKYGTREKKGEQNCKAGCWAVSIEHGRLIALKYYNTCMTSIE